MVNIKTNIFDSIVTKLVIRIGTIITFILLLTYIYLPHAFENNQIKNVENRVTTLTNITSDIVGEAITLNDKVSIHQHIISSQISEKLKYVVIQTPQEVNYYSFNLGMAKQYNYSQSENEFLSADKSVFRIKKDIEINGKIIGILYIGYSLGQLPIDVDNLKSYIELAVLIILLLVLTAVYFIGYFLIKPITSIVETVEKIEAGNLSIRSEVNSNDEIGYLSKSINSMVDRMEDTYEEIDTINQILEERVKERTEDLTASKEEAETAVKRETEFLAQMSHEIRTPVNSIMSYAQLLKDEAIDSVPEDLQFSFDMIKNGGRRLISTVDLILNISELQTGAYEINIEKCSIKEVLQQLIGEFQTAADSKGLDLTLINRLDESESNINIDIYTITQIFANLIDNAIKYTVEGSIEVIAYKNTDDILAIDVVDTGVGISKEFQKTLFDAFTREDHEYTKKSKGNGLGMALVKEYCKLNNVLISVKSKIDEGSNFTVVFPEAKLKSETIKVAV